MENCKSETSRLCGNYPAIFWVEHKNLRSIPWRYSFVSLCTFIPDQIFLDVWYFITEICVCRKDKQQDAYCLQIDLTGLIKLAKLCFSWNCLKHNLSVYLSPLPMGTCTLYKSRWPENQMWGTFFTLFKGLIIRASWSQKGEGVWYLYDEMLNHRERGAVFDLWGCAVVPYNPQ